MTRPNIFQIAREWMALAAARYRLTGDAAAGALAWHLQTVIDRRQAVINAEGWHLYSDRPRIG